MTLMSQIQILPVHGFPLIDDKTDLINILITMIKEGRLVLKEHDILIIAHTIISKAEGRIVSKYDIVPSNYARNIAEKNGFDPYQVQIAIDEASMILRDERALITLTHSGLICNFSGVDHSNAPLEHYVLLPVNSDTSAEFLRKGLVNHLGFDLGIIIADTEGRPWRRGAVNIALGCSGINAFKYNAGKQDMYGRTLRSSMVCQIDQLASAAELVMGQADEGVPLAIIRGYDYQDGKERGEDVQRPFEESLFT